VNTFGPNVIITDNKSGTTNSAILYTFTLSEASSNFAAVDIDVVGGTKGTFTAASSTSYTLSVTPDANSTSPVTVDVQAGKFTNAANKNNVVATQNSQAVDTVLPTVTISDNTSGIASSAVLYTFTLSEASTNFAFEDITVANGAKGTFTSVSPTSYTLSVTPNANSSTSITVDVTSGQFTDAVGNNNVAATQSVQEVNTLTTNGTKTNPVNTDTSVNDIINANQGSVGGSAVSFNAANGNDQYILLLGAGNQLTSTSNITISGFSSNDKIIFGATTGTTLSTLQSIYSVSDNGSTVIISGNDAGTVQSVTLTGITGSRTGVGSSIDTLTELNTFFGSDVLSVDSTLGNNSVIGNGSIASPSTYQTAGNDFLNATLGSVMGNPIAYNSAGNDQFVISLGSGNSILSGANVRISNFATGDKLVFDLDGVTSLVATTATNSQLTTLNGIYSISDNGSDISIIANNGGTVQQITLVGLTDSRSAAGVGASIDNITELNTFLGGMPITII
jgi:hypothetical protein